MGMEKWYSPAARRVGLPLRSAVLLTVVISLPGAVLLASQAPPQSKPANTYADADAHPAEHVTIAAEPFNGTKASFFHVNYPAWGLLPVRLIVTNDGDTPISLAQARIDFITAAGDKLPAAQQADMERMINTPPDPRAKIPIGPIKIGGKGKNKTKQISEDLEAYGFHSIAIEPHSTHAGFLFYDISGLDHPLMGAKLEVRKAQTSEGKEMFSFEIPFYKLGQNY